MRHEALPEQVARSTAAQRLPGDLFDHGTKRDLVHAVVGLNAAGLRVAGGLVRGEGEHFIAGLTVCGVGGDRLPEAGLGDRVVGRSAAHVWRPPAARAVSIASEGSASGVAYPTTRLPSRIARLTYSVSWLTLPTVIASVTTQMTNETGSRIMVIASTNPMAFATT